MMDRKEALQVIEENLAVDYGNLDHEQTKRLDEAIDMAIGALKAQAERTEERTETHACDLISRQAAINAVEFGITYARAINTCTGETKELFKVSNHALNEAVERLKELPSAQPERRWIPCSERMPKKNGFYLCTTNDYITILEFIEGNPHYHEEPSFVSDVLGKCNSYVVAWMPLPEPYAGRRTDDRQM